MKNPQALPPNLLFRRCDPEQFSFQTTADLEELSEIIGQERALEAVRFGIGIRRQGFNLFLLGSPGTGEYSMVRRILEQQAAKEPTPPDWCYVNNFGHPEEPRALQLPAGRGAKLHQDVQRLLEDLQSVIPSVFESENYRARKQVIDQESKERQEKAFDEIQHEADNKGIAVLRTPTGIVLAPTRKGEVLGEEDVRRLPGAELERIEKQIAKLQEKLEVVLRQVPVWEKERREKIRELNREVTIFAVGHLLDELQKNYVDLPEVMSHLKGMQQDVIQNADQFLSPPEHPLAALMGISQPHVGKGSMFLRRYQVNLLIDHSANHGAPVVAPDHPTYQNLVGQVEYMAQMGALSTDFNLIRAGALHRANGGYLVLDAYKVLLQPYAWEGLKRALRSGEMRIESLGQMLSLMSTVSLQPKPIPLEVKVVLMGERLLYYLLSAYDPEFNELFKVGADFEEHMERGGNDQLYARLIGTIARQEKLLPFAAGAVARVVEHSSRAAGDSEKLLTQRRSLQDLLREADYWAREAGQAAVRAADVQRAIDAQIHRADRVRERLQEAVLKGTLLIDTAGERTGQVNGLSVIEMGQYAFGHPSRITARVRLGKGEVIDIEREVELGGPIHSKGVLILSGFLGARYAPDRPLSLSASLVFEQSYGAVEGDSASSAELYALLSALSGAPIRQALAVTGSVNQHGEVQAIGGVNEKIEGFFDLCKARGLTGEQGVLIPASNVRHLMLRQEVVDATAAGKFQIYAVENIDQGMEILTGVPAGERDASGKFPEGSVNQRVEARLIELAEKRQAAAARQKTEGEA
ncbi:MAG: AAA family ATPase [Acidobacteriia bacterium]|nr:AAA family ATPase [Terriglobia bacterium]